MSRAVKAQGIECPIIKEGDDVASIVVENILKEIGFPQKNNINDRDIVGITESVVARAAGQYVSVDDIALDIESKFGKNATVCLVDPIYSRNRFSMILKGIARAAKKVVIVMREYDEVGNPRGVNPFTGVNIQDYYKELCEKENSEFEWYSCLSDVDSSYPNEGLTTSHAIYCGLHDYGETGNTKRYGYSLADVCSDKSPDWGLLGTNKATEEKLKLFPSKKECLKVCETVKSRIRKATGKDVVVCVYGDGCFKDPVGGIWEFADPMTMPGYTDEELLESTPNEIKLKAFIDEGTNEDEIKSMIERSKTLKQFNLKGTMASQGTTPRLYRDLLASLMDLTSGSGDRATPVVLVQNYF